jgi:hypothetical protein
VTWVKQSRRVFPLPPLDELRHGAVWLVVLEPTTSRKPVRSWYEALKKPEQPRQHLIVVSDPAKEWPKASDFFWRSRLLVGDLEKRSQEAILADFRRLLLQTPPVLRNWRHGLTTGRYDKKTWHLVWHSQVAVLL